ncbi:MAG: glycosyltransferase family 39 protein [Agriterribacter sp.]
MKYFQLLLLIIIVNATAFFSSVMEPDGALYAYVAKQMAISNDYINLYNNGDWLDKPHFPFWIIALSFKLLGISSFAYKLPAFLFWLVSLVYLYKLGKLLYNIDTAKLAVLIYATAFQAVIGLFDVRAEHYLTALTLASTYHLYQLYTKEKFYHLILAATFSAFAIMTKGLFFLTTITGGLFILIIIKKDWRQFVNYKWYLYLLLTFIFILPELYCLYVQFDIHPEKMVFGKKNVSGLRFFFWDSQFGRFLNTGPIKGTGDPSFFFHTFLWAFLPWSILFYAAIIRLIRRKKVMYNQGQWMIIGSLLVTFIIFSLSKFQLPHYVIIIFPHCALLLGEFLKSKEDQGNLRPYIIIQMLLLAISVAAASIIAVISGMHYYPWIIIFSVILSIAIFYYSRQNNLTSLIRLSVGFFVITQLFLNLFFYPQVLQYQSGESAGKWFNKNIGDPHLGLYRLENFSLKFYADSKITRIDTLPGTSSHHLPVKYYFTTKTQTDSLRIAGYPINVLQYFQDFHTSKLTAKFINKETRASQLDTTAIFRID